MSFKAVSRNGQLFYVPAALAVPPEQAGDARPALVEGDVSKITFARTWADVPAPAPMPPPPPPPAPAPVDEPIVESLPGDEPSRTERRKPR